MIYLEDFQLIVEIAIGEGVESCTENHILIYACSDGGSELFFCVAAARNHESAHCTRKRMVVLLRFSQNAGRSLRAEDGNGDGIGQHQWLLIEDLMDGAAAGNTERSFAWVAFLHSRLSVPNIPVLAIQFP